MDLFADKYYELECENQINYFDILFSKNSNTPSGYSLISTISIIHADTFSNYVIAEGTGHIQNNTSKLYCHEVQLTDTIKKIILE